MINSTDPLTRADGQDDGLNDSGQNDFGQNDSGQNDSGQDDDGIDAEMALLATTFQFQFAPNVMATTPALSSSSGSSVSDEWSYEAARQAAICGEELIEFLATMEEL